VDTPLSWFHSRSQKSNSKEAIMCMTEKDLLIRDWVGAGQLLVAAQQTVQQCNHVFVVKSFSFVVTTYNT
jgi:hypothetical protein